MVTDPAQATREAWTEAQSLYNSIVLSAAEKRRFFLQQEYYEEGENTGHLLAFVAREQKDTASILAIRSGSGEIYNLNTDILKLFHQFYTDLYSSKTNASSSVILTGLHFPSSLGD